MSYFEREKVFCQPEIGVEHQWLPDMKDKRLFVAGGTKGIGLAVADMCKELGAETIVTGRISAELPHRVIKADLTTPNGVRGVWREIKSADYVFNNVGMYEKKSIRNTTLARWKEVMGYNLDSMFLLTKEASEFMNDGGVMVNMSSRPTLDSYKDWSAYTISKVGVITLTQAIAEERPEVKAYSVCPSRVDTQYRHALFPQEDVATRLSPENVAQIVGFMFNGTLPTGSYYWIKKQYDNPNQG